MFNLLVPKRSFLAGSVKSPNRLRWLAHRVIQPREPPRRKSRALPRKTPSSPGELPDTYLIEHGVFDCLVLAQRAPPIGLFKIDLQRKILSLSDWSKPSMRSDVNPTRCKLSGCSNSSFQACNNIRGRSESASSVSEYSPPVSLLDPPGR